MNDPKESRFRWEAEYLPKFCRMCGSKFDEPRIVEGLYDSMTGKREKVKILDCPKDINPLQYYPNHDKWYIEEPIYLTGVGVFR
jgi:hypothetical protein